jgi:hypothetical protein
MQPSESAIAICKIMVGFRIKAEETGGRDDVRSAFLGLGSERSLDEFENGIAYAIEEEWLSEKSDKLKLSRTGFVVGST